jgi:hypothetical protein
VAVPVGSVVRNGRERLDRGRGSACCGAAPRRPDGCLDRLARDHYKRLDRNDDSAHPAVIGRRVQIIADLVQVRLLCDGRIVADHDRLWAKAASRRHAAQALVVLRASAVSHF